MAKSTVVGDGSAAAAAEADPDLDLLPAPEAVEPESCARAAGAINGLNSGNSSRDTTGST